MTVPDDFDARFRAALPNVDEKALELLLRHARSVVLRNEQMNLTRIVEPEDMVRKHVLDSLAALPLLESGPLAGARRLCDAGTGAGWPGLALAAARDDLAVALLDSRRKITDFLVEVTVSLGLDPRVRAHWGRLDEWIGDHRGEIDVVLARALGPIDRILSWCELGWFGPILLWKGPSVDAELKAAKPRMKRLKLKLAQDHRYDLGDGIERRLIVLAP